MIMIFAPFKLIKIIHKLDFGGNFHVDIYAKVLGYLGKTFHLDT
jgi:hypothetical protein